MASKLVQNVVVDGVGYGPDYVDPPAAVLKALGPDHPALKGDDEAGDVEAASSAPSER